MLTPPMSLDQMGMLVDLSQYLTEDERARYVQGYLDEGDLTATAA